MSWTRELEKRGEYYEGWVEDVENRLSSHSMATVTCYGTRRSAKPASGNSNVISMYSSWLNQSYWELGRLIMCVVHDITIGLPGSHPSLHVGALVSS